EVESNPAVDENGPSGTSNPDEIDAHRCIPEMRKLRWEDFNKETPRPYAVDVLEGGHGINFTFSGRGLLGLAGLKITRVDSSDDEGTVGDDKDGKNEDMGKENRAKNKKESVLDVVTPLMLSELSRQAQIAEGKADGADTLP